MSAGPARPCTSAPSGRDITDAMTPITGGCGPHCTVAADPLGRPREAHCGCRECHGGGLAPVTGWPSPERRAWRYHDYWVSN
jgi:hypothetical protein